MESYLKLLKEHAAISDDPQKVKFIIEKRNQIFGNSVEFNNWLNKLLFNADSSNVKNIELNFIDEEMERLAQGYCL